MCVGKFTLNIVVLYLSCKVAVCYLFYPMFLQDIFIPSVMPAIY